MRKRNGMLLAALLILCLMMAGGVLSVYAADDKREDDLSYILGRPMTEEEVQQQEAMIPKLQEMPAPEEAEPILNRESRAGAIYQGLERFDLREQGIVTSVKNQVIGGPCWTFSAMALAESSMLRQGAPADVDFSEEHLAYFFYNRADDPLKNTAGDRNIINWAGYNYKNIGGNLQLASKFLSTWSGVAKEDAAPYSGGISQLDSELAYLSEAHLQNAFFINASAEEIKEALYAGQQPVGVNYNHQGSYYNASTGAYSYPKAGNINHAVTIVGWDDTYKK